MSPAKTKLYNSITFIVFNALLLVSGQIPRHAIPVHNILFADFVSIPLYFVCCLAFVLFFTYSPGSNTTIFNCKFAFSKQNANHKSNLIKIGVLLAIQFALDILYAFALMTLNTKITGNLLDIIVVIISWIAIGVTLTHGKKPALPKSVVSFALLFIVLLVMLTPIELHICKLQSDLIQKYADSFSLSNIVFFRSPDVQAKLNLYHTIHKLILYVIDTFLGVSTIRNLSD